MRELLAEPDAGLGRIETSRATAAATRSAAWGRRRAGPHAGGREGPGPARFHARARPAFPAIGNPDFLALAQDELIAATVMLGRPGRRMPAWGEGSGGLRPGEITAVVAYVQQMGGVEPLPDPKSQQLGEGRREGGPATGPGVATGSEGRGRRSSDGWTVVLSRRLPAGLAPGGRSQVAFAVWEGSKQEAGSRKMRTGWVPIQMQAAK